MGKEKKLVIRESAYEDLNSQLNYFNINYSFEYALRFANEFIEETEKIYIDYNSFPECQYLRTKSRIYRVLVWGNYWIIYKIRSESIEVLSLFHTKRNPANLNRLRRLKQL